jgi:hypothetical protein
MQIRDHNSPRRGFGRDVLFVAQPYHTPLKKKQKIAKVLLCCVSHSLRQARHAIARIPSQRKMTQQV